LIKLIGKDLAYWERNQILLYLTKLFQNEFENYHDDHIEADELLLKYIIDDELLLKYIIDDEVRCLFEKIEKWYS
jgi:hypothetical protein